MRARAGLEAELRAVEERLRAATASREPLLSEMARWMIDAGGKRLRPLCALMAYRAVGGGEGSLGDVIEIAAGLELIHTATLVHDDINDGAKTRRGREACHRRYGRANAIILGDFLFTKGFQISGRFDESVVAWTADACQNLAEGEILQGRFLGDPSAITLDDYITLVERKTAAFIATGIRIGAHLGGADDALVESMGRYGLNLGIAFQIVDDLLDVAGDGAVTGKHVGLDIRDGNPTLPSILAMQGEGDGPPRLLQILSAPQRGPAEVGEALALIRGSGALEEGRLLAERYGERARRELVNVPDAEWREHLAELVDLVVARDR